MMPNDRKMNISRGDTTNSRFLVYVIVPKSQCNQMNRTGKRRICADLQKENWVIG